MLKFIPNKEHSRAVLIVCLHLKETAAESYRLFRQAYGEHAPSQDACERWFRPFKNGDFYTRQEARQRTWKDKAIKI